MSQREPMSLKQLWQRLEDETARLERVIFIAGMLGDGESLAAPLAELLEEDPDALKDCFHDLPQAVEAALCDPDRSQAAEAFFEWSMESGKLGFVVRMATPVMRHSSPNSATYSWGRYRTALVYGDTLEQAIEAGLEWVAAVRMGEKASQLAKAVEAS